jgi:hypothetical protein
MAKKITKKIEQKRRSIGLLSNTRPTLILMLLPILVGFGTLAIVGTGLYSANLANLSNNRLVTPNWESARDALKAAQPEYIRQFAYYKVKEGQTIEDIARYFSVSVQTLTTLNPGIIATGTNIKVPPVEKPYEPTAGSNGTINEAVVTDDAGILRIQQKYRLKRQIITTIPELAAFLAPYKAIDKTGPATYRINRMISIDGNIRLDITSKTVKKLELRSQPNNITCLCMDESSALLDGVEVVSYDPATKGPDLDASDGRSFVRMKNGRMDVLNSKFTYLGNGLEGLKANSKIYPPQREGGVYGVSWRISDDQLGSKIATGWVEGSQFAYNHFGAYTYGASGMTWRNNHFYKNEVYGLDPHDDSNNALVENNFFDSNGKHGFIVSKRCNYNIIRNNTSYNNKLHGFMLHQDSAYNVIENNVSYGNVDNYVIYDSNYNMIRNNVGYAARSSQVRINKKSGNTYILNNQFYGGKRGIFLYDGVLTTYVANNELHGVGKELSTRGAQGIVFEGNIVDNLNYDIPSTDRLIFGINTVQAKAVTIPATPALPQGYTLGRAAIH